MISFLSTLTISLVLVKIFTFFSRQLGIIDIPNARSSHTDSIPSGSGIAILSSIVLVLLFTDLKDFQNYSFSIIAILFVFTLGVYDDFKNSSPRYKLLIISIGAIFLYIDGLMISNIGTYFNYTITLSWLSMPFTIVAVVGFTNALNLIDGLDGLAASISIVIFASLWFIGQQNNDPVLSLVSPIIISALLVFLVFNWNPAKVFMGDCGSLTLGFIISILAIKAGVT
jgi:UDP-GlcNAc:undecaprenyl-phosphate GlcNAc-1-phosphate transferase